MSIRYKLFLIVGIVSCVIFMGSFFLENFLTQRGVSEAREDIHKFYVELEEQKRKHVEDFLSINLSGHMGNIDATLQVISKFQRVLQYFIPSAQNIETGTWKSAASLLQNRSTIDFIQNTTEGKVLSLIVPRHEAMQDVFQVAIEQDYGWVYWAPQDGKKPTMIGVLLTLKPDHDGVMSETSVPGVVPSVYVLYEPKAVLAFPDSLLQEEGQNSHKAPIALSVPFIEGYSLDLEGFLRSLARCKTFLMEENAPSPDENPLKKTQGSQNCIRSLECFLDLNVQYINQLFMIWEAASLLESGLMGSGIDSSFAPKGISFFPDDTGKGQVIDLQAVMFEQSFFSDQAYISQHQPREGSTIASSLSVISSPHYNRIFLGNTAQLKGEAGEKTGLLTLGFDMDSVLKELSLNFHEMSWVVSGGKIISAVTEEGQKFDLETAGIKELDPKLDKDQGFVDWQQASYYFIRMKPYDDIDLYFYLFNLSNKEFSLMQKLNDEIEKVSDAINVDRRYVILLGLLFLLLSLLNLSKKITSTVIALAQASKQVIKGKWDQVNIPKANLGKNNEIQQLCNAFEDMVVGMQEKEKVKGILNKVVSQDIAKEILKGEVHLGGEEREVTIFFADIRQFTKITQHMNPKEVIELINNCMTRLSHVIDDHHGVIDKYIGDGVMVLFGAPLYREDSACKAIESAIEILRDLQEWNNKKKSSHIPIVHMGIGIHTGKVCAGNMGAENRLNYTVIGSNVNLASRLCSVAKPGEILISQDTLSAPFVAERFEVQDMGMMDLKGFDASIRVYKVIGYK